MKAHLSILPHTMNKLDNIGKNTFVMDWAYLAANTTTHQHSTSVDKQNNIDTGHQGNTNMSQFDIIGLVTIVWLTVLFCLPDNKKQKT